MTELVRTYKLTDSGAWGWVTEEAEGGGGGSLPSWWTVDSTPGSESVEFAGAVTISPSNEENPLTVIGNAALAQADALARFKDSTDTFSTQIKNDGSIQQDVDTTSGFAQRITDANSSDVLWEIGPTGAVTISPSDPAAQPFMIVLPDDFAAGAYTAFRILRPGQDPSIFNEDLATIEMDGLYLRAGPGEGADKPVVNLLNDDATPGLTSLRNGKLNTGPGEVMAWAVAGPTVELSFFGAGLTAKPTGVAATGPGVHAALVTLGLIAA